MRFYRAGQEKNTKDEAEYNEPYRTERGGQSGQDKQEKNNKEIDSPTGREILGQIPTMGYEDVNLEMDEKNALELKKIQQKNLEEKLALNEVEKFKKENKRLPNQKESDSIAENLYTQLKNSNINELYGKDVKVPTSQSNQHAQRGRRRVVAGGTIPGEEKIQTNKNNSVVQTPQKENINDILGNNERLNNQKKKSSEDEFNLDLGDEDNSSSKEAVSSEEDVSSIEEIKDDAIGGLELEDKEECPNCKKETERVLYCPNCGTAFCENCSKKQGEYYLCPKCGTRCLK